MTNAHTDDDLPEQIRVRRDKRERLLAEGIPVYPNTVERTHTLAEVRATYDPQELDLGPWRQGDPARMPSRNAAKSGRTVRASSPASAARSSNPVRRSRTKR